MKKKILHSTHVFFCFGAALLFASCAVVENTPVGGAPVAANSSIVMSASTTTQNTTITATITLKDIKNLPSVGIVPVLSVTPSAGTTIGTCTASSRLGVSTCSFRTTVATTYTPSISSPISVTGTAFTVYQSPTSMSFTTQPASTTSGVVFTSNVALSVLDVNSAAVSTPTPGTLVTLTISGTDSTAVMTLGGVACASTGCTASIVAGAVTFTNLSIDKVGTYTLSASVNGVSVSSSSFNVTYGAASAIAFSTQPSSTVNINREFAQIPIVQVRDAAGNIVTGHANDSSVAVTLTLQNCAAATLIGSSAVASAGVANFTNSGIRFDSAASAANCTLQASATLLSGAVTATSSAFAINAFGASTKLVYSTSISTTGAVGVPLNTPAVVYVTDASGNINTTDNTTSITVSKSASSTGTGLLNGTLTQTVVNGVATFTDLYFDQAGAYSITASSGALTSSVTPTITISALGTASRLSISQQPVDSAVASIVNSSLVSNAITLRILDSNGHLVNTSTANVTATLSSGTGTLGGTVTRAAVAGIVTFNDLTISAVGGAKVLTFSSTGLTGVSSNTFNIYSIGTARKLVFRQQPTQTSTNAVDFTTQPIVQVVDEHGIIVTTHPATLITLACSYSNASCAGTVNNNTANTVNGVATFANTNFSAADYNLVLEATGGGLEATQTNPNLVVQ